MESTDLRNGVKEKAFGKRLDAEKERHLENYFSFRLGMLVMGCNVLFKSPSNHDIPFVSYSYWCDCPISHSR